MIPPRLAPWLLNVPFLWHLGGGCTVPIAALAQCQGAELHMQGLVSTPDGSQSLAPGAPWRRAGAGTTRRVPGSPDAR